MGVRLLPGGADPGDAFEEMQEIAGSRYDLLAYFMFLKDSTRSCR